MKGARVQSLVRELRSRVLHGVAKKKKKEEKKGWGEEMGEYEEEGEQEERAHDNKSRKKTKEK